MSSWSGSAQAREHAERITRALEAARRNLDRSPSRHSSQGYETCDDNDNDSDDDQAQQIQALLHNSRPSSPALHIRPSSRPLSSLSPTRSITTHSSQSLRASDRRDYNAIPSYQHSTTSVPLESTASGQLNSNPFDTQPVSRQPSRNSLGHDDLPTSNATNIYRSSPSPSLGHHLTSPPRSSSRDAQQNQDSATDADESLLSRISQDSDGPGAREMKAAVLASLGPNIFMPPHVESPRSQSPLTRRSISPMNQSSNISSEDSTRPVSPLSHHHHSPHSRQDRSRSIVIPERRASRAGDLTPSGSDDSTASNLLRTGKPPIRVPRPRGNQPPLRNPFRDSLASDKDVRPIYTSRKSSLTASTPISYRDLGSDFTRYPKQNDANRRHSTFTDTSSRPNSSGKLIDDRAASRQSTISLADSLASTTFSSEKGMLSQSYAVDPEKGYTPFLDDRLGAPPAEKGGYSYKMYHDEPEDDDEMHMPAFDDDIRHKPRWRDHFTRGNVGSSLALLGLLVLILGIIVGLPVASGTGAMQLWDGYSTPLSWFEQNNPADGPPWARVNNRTYSLFQNLRTGLVDPDTPQSARTTYSTRGQKMNLVFSDEFNKANRTFYPGDDPFWYAPDFWYGSTGDIDWYSPENVNTGDGNLLLTLSKFHSHGLDYLSGMLHSWNQTCFKGGKFEVGVSLPGPAGVAGLWPGAWSMGNLGRPGYRATTDGVWPYTYNSCDSGITHNQSLADGTSKLPGQRLSSCTCHGSDHPTPGTGRGAPEIDIFEAAVGGGNMPTVTQSYQVAPFDVWYYPNYEYFEFPNIEDNFTAPNGYTGGPYQQALSATSTTNKQWFDGHSYQSFAYEYQPTSFTGHVSDSYIAWFIGDDVTLRMSGDAIGPNGNVNQRLISEEPMSLVLNLGFSHNWGYIDWEKLVFPTTMRIDYVRWYQLEGHEKVTCDPPGYETTEYIAEHSLAYTNPNITLWDDAGYPWPQDSLTSDCKQPNHPAHPRSPAAQPYDGSDAGPGA